MRPPDPAPLAPGLPVRIATALSLTILLCSSFVSCRDDKDDATPPSPYGAIGEYNQPEHFVQVAMATSEFVKHERFTSEKRTPPLLRELKDRNIAYFTYGSEQVALFVDPERAYEVIGLGVDPGGFAVRFLDSPGFTFRDYLARRMFMQR